MFKIVVIIEMGILSLVVSGSMSSIQIQICNPRIDRECEYTNIIIY